MKEIIDWMDRIVTETQKDIERKKEEVKMIQEAAKNAEEHLVDMINRNESFIKAAGILKMHGEFSITNKPLEEDTK